MAFGHKDKPPDSNIRDHLKGRGQPEEKHRFPLPNLAEGVAEVNIREASRILGASFRNEEDILPRIKELLLSEDENARSAAHFTLLNLANRNPYFLATKLPDLLPLLKRDRLDEMHDPYDSIVKVVRKIADLDALLIPDPKAIVDAMLFTHSKVLNYLESAVLSEEERAKVEKLAQHDPNALRNLMEVIYRVANHEKMREGDFLLAIPAKHFEVHMGFYGAMAGLGSEAACQISDFGPDLVRKLFAPYFAVRDKAHPLSKESCDAIDAVIDGTMRLLKVEKHKTEALKRLGGLAEVWPLGSYRVQTLIDCAEGSTDENYILICKAIRNALKGGEEIPFTSAAKLLLGVSERSEEAQKEGRAAAKKIRQG